jgi:hypothetical protein
VATAEGTKAGADAIAEDTYTLAVNTAGFQQLSRNQQAAQTRTQASARNQTTYAQAVVQAGVQKDQAFRAGATPVPSRLAEYTQQVQGLGLSTPQSTFFIAIFAADEACWQAINQASDQAGTATQANRVQYETAIIAPEEIHANAVESNYQTYFRGAMSLMQTMHQAINSAGQQGNQAAREAGDSLTNTFATEGETWADATTDAETLARRSACWTVAEGVLMSFAFRTSSRSACQRLQ